MRQREFFRISPETAYGIFKDIATLRGDVGRLKLYEPTPAQSEEQALVRRTNNSFDLLQIPVGDKIAFLYDETITAEVADGRNQVIFESAPYSVSALARKILTGRFGWSESLHVNGWRYFTKNGVTLSDLRNSMESAEEEES